jgi:HEAT repeat protein
MHRSSYLVLAALALLAAGPHPGGAPPAHAQPSAFLNKAPDKWRNQLKAPSPNARRSAAFALGRLGESAYRYVGDLAPLVRDDKDAAVREMVATALAEIVLAAQPDTTLWDKAGPLLMTALDKDPDARVRRSAAYGLGAFGRLAADATPSLKTALRHPSPEVRRNAAWALGRVGPGQDARTITELCEGVADLLRDRDPLVRRDAASALGHLGRAGGKAAAQALFDLVTGEGDDVVRRAALDALAPVAGPEHRALAPRLYKLLESRDDETARSAALVLGNVGSDAALPALPHLSRALAADLDPAVQALAAAGLNNIGPKASPAIGALKRALAGSRDPFVRRNSALALANIAAGVSQNDSDGGPAFPRLADELKPAVGALADALKAAERQDSAAKQRAAEATREYAAEALARMGHPANEAALGAMCAAIKPKEDANPVVRQKCIWALFELKPADAEKYGLEKVLKAVLDERGPGSNLVRYDAARALAFLKREAAPDKAVDVLLQMMADKTLLVYHGTGTSITGTGALEGPAGTSKVEAKARDDARYMAAHALGYLGRKVTDRPDAVKALRAAAADKGAKKLSETARQALIKLRLDDEP